MREEQEWRRRWQGKRASSVDDGASDLIILFDGAFAFRFVPFGAEFGGNFGEKMIPIPLRVRLLDLRLRG